MGSKLLWQAIKEFDQKNGFQIASGIRGRVFHVDTANGDNGNDGLFAGQGEEYATGHAFETMAKALTMIDSYDAIIVDGDVREQVVAPLGVYDVKIIGGANAPRQATSGGVHTGGGSTWRAPASPTAATALLELIEQAWEIMNIFFVPHTSSPGILMTRAEDAVHPDPSHARIHDCVFASGTTNIGIKDVGGCYKVEVYDNIFQSTTGYVVSSTGVAVPTLNRFLRNIFDRCTTGISGSFNYSYVLDNMFRMTANDGTVPKINMKAVSNQGTSNYVLRNYFPDAAANVAIAKGYTPATSDVWRNFVTDAADAVVTVPA